MHSCRIRKRAVHVYSPGVVQRSHAVAWPVAAPDYKIRQCIQRSAVFLGRADGWTEGPERGAGGVKLRSAEGVEFEEGHCSPSLLGSLGLCPRKKSKINFEIACFLFCNFAN